MAKIPIKGEVKADEKLSDSERVQLNEMVKMQQAELRRYRKREEPERIKRCMSDAHLFGLLDYRSLNPNIELRKGIESCVRQIASRLLNDRR